MHQSKLDFQGLLAALCATAAWGMAGIFIRWLPGWSPFLILVGRFLVAIVAMIPILLVTPNIRKSLTRSLSTPLIWCLSLPAIGSYLLGTSSLQMAPVGEVTLLFTTSPLFVIAAKVIMRSPIKRGEWVGTGLAMIGVSLMILPKISIVQSISWQTIAGYGLALGAAGLVALYAAWFKFLAYQRLAPRSIEVVFVTFILGSILSLLCAICFSGFSVGAGINRHTFLVLIGLGTLSTAVAFLCYTVSAQRLPIMLSSALLLLEPIFAVLFAAIALQEIPSPWFAVGSFFVFGGLLSIARASHAE
jgi:drug/metabolite transporter (DMT)-like permease